MEIDIKENFLNNLCKAQAHISTKMEIFIKGPGIKDNVMAKVVLHSPTNKSIQAIFIDMNEQAEEIFVTILDISIQEIF